jgi:pre-mRNA-splicing helicase BRR2
VFAPAPPVAASRVTESIVSPLATFKRPVPAQERQLIGFGFNAPEEVGAHNLNLYFMSDSYLGCDQEYEIELNVSEAKMDEEEDEEEKE